MTHANVWNYRESLRTGESGRTEDLVGYEVQATDGAIGKVSKLSAETSRHYIVVDTGFWIFGKKRLVPAGVIERVDHAEQTIYVSMTKDQIKSAPDFDDQRSTYDDADYEPYGTYYTRYGDM